jgi:hypothetical protein
VWSGRASVERGRIQEGIQILEDADHRGAEEELAVRGYLGYAYGRAGRRREAENLAAEASDPFIQALTYAGIGDKERTVQALERMAPMGPVRLGRNLTYPEFALLHGDPRVKALRKKVGLPE